MNVEPNFVAVVLAVALALPAVAVAQQSGNRTPPTAVISLAGQQRWQYEQVMVCKTEEINANDYSKLIMVRFRALGAQGFELVSVVNYPIPPESKTEVCIYAVFKRPAPQ
jgi:hypothetical protein